MKIHFSQCGMFDAGVDILKQNLPINIHCEHMERNLSFPEFQDKERWTYSEHVLLIAQWLKRQGKIKELIFVSHCFCGKDEKIIEIPIDDQGEFTADCPHGFFPQRCKYLFD